MSVYCYRRWRLYASSLMLLACCIRPYLYAYLAILYSWSDLARRWPCVGPTFAERIGGFTRPPVDAASVSTSAASLALIGSAFFDPRSFLSNGMATLYSFLASIGRCPTLFQTYSVFCIEVMSREVLYVIELLLSLQFPFQRLSVAFLFELLEIGLLISYFHIP